MNVGFIGLGLMGGSMARNVMAAGHELSIWNRNPAAGDALAAAGATVATTAAELGASVDVLCLCLPNGAIVREALLGPDGALSNPRPGLTVIDHSTISRDDATALAADCGKLSITFIDAPVSGGPEGAAAGELAVFVGGDRDVFDRVSVVIESYGSTVVYLGGPGSGQIAKLANQMIIGTTMLGIAEAFAYCQAEGVDAAALLQVLEAATADSKMLRTRTPVPGLQPAMPASNDWRPGFTADFMAKDLGFALAGANALDLPTPGLALVAALLDRARDAGHGQDDWTVLSQFI